MLLAATPAECLAASATELAVARRLFEDAVRLEHESRWELAASKLRDALAVKDTPGLRFHLAHCEEQLGHLVEALINYDQARELIAAGAKAPDVEALLEPARSALEARIPTLLLVAPAEVEQLEVELDGKALARSVVGRPAPMNPAKHRVLARAPGYRDYDEEVLLIEGERRTVQLNMVRLPVAAAPTSVAAQPVIARAPEPNSTSSAKTYILAGESAFAVAALGVGIGFWMAQNTAEDRISRIQSTLEPGICNTKPTSDTPRPEECGELTQTIDDYNTARRFSTIGFVGAGAGAVATVLTFALWPSAPATPRVQPSASGTWFGIDGRF
ncbi:MAG TPA: hypothetical protein VG937_27770 [Polyangiaceae bacterium]|nr:hypothetical protein [Polyangiaceae bacterium]